MSAPSIHVLKADGTKEEFNEDKFRTSLFRSGAKPDEIEKISTEVRGNLKEEISTGQIYHIAFSALHKMRKPAAARYSLRRALLELGPSGFPFERFLSEILKAKGYSVATNQFLTGACVPHEIDVVAWDEKKLVMIEAKFHNELAVKTDLKVALYVKARYDDLLEQQFNYGGRPRNLDEGWIMTNTKFTTNVIKYAKCAGLTLVGWNYPLKGNLHDLVEETGLHPVTCLSTLSQQEKRAFMEQNLVLCKDVDENRLTSIGFSKEKSRPILDEAKLLCKI